MFQWSPDAGVKVEWQPAFPSIRSPRHRRKFFAAYVQARAEFLEMLAATRGNIAVLDLPRDWGALTIIEKPVKH